MDLNGVVWTPLASGHIASFDRRKCKGPLNGPQAATASSARKADAVPHARPAVQGLDESGSANNAYYLWVDRYTRSGSAETCQSR